MKATLSNKKIIVNKLNTYEVLVYTDVQNISYCLARIIAFYSDFGSVNNFFKILKKQKSIRAVVQKFNAICKALEI